MLACGADAKRPASFLDTIQCKSQRESEPFLHAQIDVCNLGRVVRNKCSESVMRTYCYFIQLVARQHVRDAI